MMQVGGAQGASRPNGLNGNKQHGGELLMCAGPCCSCYYRLLLASREEK